MTDYIGQQFGNYRLTRFLGEGGFATVYLGEHIHLNTRAAIKVLNTKIINQEVEQFRREAYLLAHLNHPHITRVFDFGLEEKERQPFLVMQYAAHGTLRQQHPKGQIVPLVSILTYLKPVAAALQYAHNNRIIHRDVKPENMLIGDQNEILLSDFGIALLAQTTQLQQTQEFIGTVSYMSPEQIQGKPQPASDQYSLGIVVYEWLAGTYPFRGSFMEVCTQHMMAPPPPLRQRVPGIPQEVEQVVLRALAKDPKERFGTIEDFATAFVEAAEGRTRTPVALLQNVAGTAERDARNRASVSFTPSVSTGYIGHQEGKVDAHSATEAHSYAPQHTVQQAQEPLHTTSQKGRKGLLVGVILAVLILILGSGGAFAVITTSNQAHELATATANHTATTIAVNRLATATAQTALLTSAADFTTQSPQLSNMTIVSNDAAFDTDHSVLWPGKQVVVAFTLRPNVKSVFLTIRALVSQDGPNNPGLAPINIFCNNQVVVSDYTMPGNGYTANTTSIQIPAQQLTPGNNQLRLLISTNAKTNLWLYNLKIAQSTGN